LIVPFKYFTYLADAKSVLNSFIIGPNVRE